MLEERNGSRHFERISRWNRVMYTTISRKSTYAPYAEPDSNKGDKLWFNYFVVKAQTIPIRQFQKLDNPVILDDRTCLSMKDPNSDLWLEVDAVNEKVRLYQEKKNDNN